MKFLFCLFRFIKIVCFIRYSNEKKCDDIDVLLLLMNCLLLFHYYFICLSLFQAMFFNGESLLETIMIIVWMNFMSLKWRFTICFYLFTGILLYCLIWKIVIRKVNKCVADDDGIKVGNVTLQAPFIFIGQLFFIVLFLFNFSIGLKISRFQNFYVS